MKRKAPRAMAGARYRDVLRNFTDEQLRGIGTVAMTFNDAQRSLQELLGPCLRWPAHYEIVASRVNGMEGIAAIIRAAAKNLIRLVAAAFAIIRGLDVSADMAAVDFYFAAKLAGGFLFNAQHFAQFVRQHESDFELHIKVASQLRRAGLSRRSQKSQSPRECHRWQVCGSRKLCRT